MTTMMIPVTDLCDAHEDQLASGAVRVLAPVFHSFGARAAFAGPAATLKVFEDNGLVRAMLEQPGEGRVLVVDGGGSLRCALVGGNLAKLAEDNGWEGVLVNGCVRDTREPGRLQRRRACPGCASAQELQEKPGRARHRRADARRLHPPGRMDLRRRRWRAGLAGAVA